MSKTIFSSEEQIKKEIFEKIKQYYDDYASKFSRKSKIIQPAQKKYDEKELISAVDAVLDCWWTDGKKTKEFERVNFGYYKESIYQLKLFPIFRPIISVARQVAVA